VRQRGYDKRWENFRVAFLKSRPLCEFCLGQGISTPATVCDHDIPHRDDPELFWNNTFTALCKKCHDGTKQRLERRFTGEALLAKIKELKHHSS